MFETTINVMGMQIPIKAAPEDVLGLLNKAGIQVQPFTQAANSLASTLNRWFPSPQAEVPTLPPPTAPEPTLPTAIPIVESTALPTEGFVLDHTGARVSLQDLERAFALKAAAQTPKLCKDCVLSDNLSGLPNQMVCGKCFSDPLRPTFVARPMMPAQITLPFAPPQKTVATPAVVQPAPVTEPAT